MSCPTKDKILNAAELAFAECGFEAASLRVITRRAKVNLAAVNYHFGDKESLYLEVIRRRMNPINRNRLANLEQVLSRSATEPPPLTLVLEAMLLPVFEAHQDPSKGGPAIVKIIARTLTEPLPFTREFVSEEFHGIFGRFSQAIRRSTGNIPPEDFLWRMSFVIGAMQHTLATLHEMSRLTRGICKSDDYEAALRQFVVAAAAVFTAPAPAAAFLPNQAPNPTRLAAT